MVLVFVFIIIIIIIYNLFIILFHIFYGSQVSLWCIWTLTEFTLYKYSIIIIRKFLEEISVRSDNVRIM